MTVSESAGSIAAMDTKKEKPYFAPPAEGAPPEGEVPSWGEDAQAIARQAGLGSYGPETTEQEKREEVLLRIMERVDGEVAGLRSIVLVLCGVVAVLGAVVGWLVLR